MYFLFCSYANVLRIFINTVAGIHDVGSSGFMVRCSLLMVFYFIKLEWRPLEEGPQVSAEADSGALLPSCHI